MFRKRRRSLPLQRPIRFHCSHTHTHTSLNPHTQYARACGADVVAVCYCPLRRGDIVQWNAVPIVFTCVELFPLLLLLGTIFAPSRCIVRMYSFCSYNFLPIERGKKTKATNTRAPTQTLLCVCARCGLFFVFNIRPVIGSKKGTHHVLNTQKGQFLPKKVLYFHDVRLLATFRGADEKMRGVRNCVKYRDCDHKGPCL